MVAEPGEKVKGAFGALLDIGRRVYEGELSRYDAAEEYDLNYYTVREYERAYRESKDLPPKQIRRKNTV